MLLFSPAFEFGFSPSNTPSSPHKTVRKRKRRLEPLGLNCGDSGSEEFEADSATHGISLSSNTFVTTSLAGPDEDNSHDHNVLHPQVSSHTGHNGSHAGSGRPLFLHHVTETMTSMAKGRISTELATLRPPFYVCTQRLPNPIANESSNSTKLRHHHLQTIIAVLHRCLSERDYIRASRAWAMLLRAEQYGQSVDLRTHDQWGVGAEILLQHDLQMAQKSMDPKFGKISNSILDSRAKSEIMEKAKEYYESVTLQYPYRKAFPSATGALNFSLAMFSLWIHTLKEWSSIAFSTVVSSNGDIDETDTEANEKVQGSLASGNERDRYQKREQVIKNSLASAHEITARLNGLLVSPPHSDNAQLWKLCGEISSWIADLSTATVALTYRSRIGVDGGDQTMVDSSLLRVADMSATMSQDYRTVQERQKALATASEAFQRVKKCGEQLTE